MKQPLHPALYQVNTRVWLATLSRQLGRAATLDDIADSDLDHIAGRGFDWVWFLSVWQSGEASREVSRRRPEWRREFAETLPDLDDNDIAGSGFAISAYTVHRDLGGDAALARLRRRLRVRGLRLMLDFVPNHVALDHPWVDDHPGYFIAGSAEELRDAPANYTRVGGRSGERVLAHGRDPYFPGWPDTLQLDYGNPALQDAMTAELVRIAGQCDGVRCDMAMLVLPEVFEGTWGRKSAPFWPKAIERVRDRCAGFCFMAEVYWDLEWALQQQGFDYTYDKRLYDRLRAGLPRPVREHFLAGLDFQARLVRFLENHDEPRAAATFEPGRHEAAAVITYLAPGLRLFHQGQFEGRRIRISPHLVRAPEEPVDEALQVFYERLLGVLRLPVVREGHWTQLHCTPAWYGNASSEAFVASAWHDESGMRLIVAVNYAAHASQCYVRLPFGDLGGRRWVLRDRLGEARYERDGSELEARGLFLDVPAWQAHAFEVACL